MANNNSFTPYLDAGYGLLYGGSGSTYDPNLQPGNYPGAENVSDFWNAGNIAENYRQNSAERASALEDWVRSEISAERAWVRSEESAKRAYTREALQAKINREWQTELSNTAYERATSSMLRAGINPAFAFGAGASGASTPSGSTARAQAASSPQGQAHTARAAANPMANVFQFAIGSAVQIASAVSSAVLGVKSLAQKTAGLTAKESFNLSRLDQMERDVRVREGWLNLAQHGRRKRK